MIDSLLRKTFNDARWLLLACCGVLFALGWIRVIVVASLELHQMQRLVRNLPELIQRLSPVPLERLVNYPGLISFTYEEPLAYLIMAVWTISRGSDCVSGELGRGTLEMLLAQPVSRPRYLVTHTSVTLLGVALLALAAHAGTLAGIQTTDLKLPAARRQFTVPFLGMKVEAPAPPNEFRRVPIGQFVRQVPFSMAAINYASLGVLLLGLSTAMSSWDRYRWRTIGIVVGVYVVQTIVELLGMSIPRLRWMLQLTFFSAYEPVRFVIDATHSSQSPWDFWAINSHGRIPDLGPLGCNLLLLSLGVSGLIVGTVIFCRRDIPAPL